MRNIRQTIAEIFLLATAFVLPLKFGTIAVMPEASAFFPGTLFDYMIISWSANLFPIAAGIALVLCLFGFPGAVANFRSPAWRFAVLWSAGLLLFSLPGLINASAVEFAYMELVHFAGIGAFAMAAYLYLAADPARYGKRLLAVLAVGMLILSYLGLEQYFWGFEQSRQYLLDQEAKGIQVGGVLKARAFDDRVFATFTSCNSLAGYMLLLLPMLVASLWRWGSRVEPVKISRILFVAIGGGAALAVLLLTKSRAAYLAIALTAALAAVAWPMRRRWKITLLALMAATVLAGAFYIHRHGRGFESMEARADYLRSSVLLLARHPFAGCGWGEFFFEHMRIKAIESHEAAHDPHNLVMTAAQAGLPLTLLVIFGMAYPLCLIGRRVKRIRRESGEWPVDEVAALIGLTAFYIHSMMEIHIQIPAVMAAYFAFSLAMLIREEPEAPSDAPRALKPGLRVFFLMFGLGAIVAGDRILNAEIAFDKLTALSSRANKSPAEMTQVSPDAVRLMMREAVRARPYSSFPYSAAADFMLSRDNLDEAEALYIEAIKRAPKRPSLYLRRSIIALRRGDADKAREWMAKARELFPNNPEYQK